MFFAENHRHHAPRKVYLLGVTVAFLVINVWIAIDHYQIQHPITRQAVDALDGTKQIAKQRSALLAARPDNGPIDLEMMKKAGVRVPNSFVHGGAFASPWGQSQIMKQYDTIVWDFYDITSAGCTQLLGNSGAIDGVVRVAASARAADERPTPLSQGAAEQECRRPPLMARLILK